MTRRVWLTTYTASARGEGVTVRKRKLGVVTVLSVIAAVAVAGQGADAYPSGGALPPPLTLVVSITGSADVPIDARGVALNVASARVAGRDDEDRAEAGSHASAPNPRPQCQLVERQSVNRLT